jgi:hypothetical protein
MPNSGGDVLMSMWLGPEGAEAQKAWINVIGKKASQVVEVSVA